MGETQTDLLRRVDEQARKVLRTGEDADVASLLRVYDDALAAVIRDVEATWTALQSMQPDDPRARFLEWKRTRESALRDQIAHRLEQLRQNAVETLRSGLLSMYEDQFVLDAYALDEATPPSVVVNLRGVTPSQAEGIVATPWKGALFSDRVWVLSDDMLREMQNALGQSALLGEGIDEAVRRLRDLKALDGNVPPRYALERLARTELLKAADRARERLYQDNESVVEGEQILVTLDDRTCEICGPLDGLDLDSKEAQDQLDEFDADTRPPFHPNCRCTTIPKLKSWRDLLGTDELPDDLRGFDPTERIVRGPDGRSVIAPRQSFEQWMNARVIARVGTHEARQEQHRQLQESNRAAGCCLHGRHDA